MQVDPSIRFKFRNNPVHHRHIPIVSTQMGIPIRRLHFKKPVPNIQNRDIKSPTAQIINRNLLILLLIQSVGQRGRRRLVNDPQNFQPSNFPRVFRCLTLTIVEISRHRDHRLGDFFSQLRFRIRLEFGQNKGGNFLGRKRFLLPLHFHFDMGIPILRCHHFVGQPLGLFLHFDKFATDQPLDRKNRVLGIGHRLPLRRLPHHPLPTLRKSHNRRSGARSLRVF